jgi:dipeptidase E
MPDGIEKFYAAFSKDRCDPSHLAFFRKPSLGSIPLSKYAEHLLAQDVVYVSGGNTKSALGVWHEWGLNRVFRRAYASGVLLCGMSAGAMCWFESGWTDSYWGAGFQPLRCLGLLGGGCAVHYNSDDERRKGLHSAVASGEMPATIALDDYSAALFENGALAKVVRWRVGAGAYLVSNTAGLVEEIVHEAMSIEGIET